jgi:tRNA(Ile)-lysidine synthase
MEDGRDEEGAGSQGAGASASSTLEASTLSDQEIDARLAPFVDAKLLLAVSGGPDSLALAAAAAAWRLRRPGPPLRAATLDHGLRPSSRDEARATLEACARLGLPCDLLIWEEAAPGPRLQERARAARYRLLAQAARACGATVILTAHHADDQAETMLFRLARGSGPAGLCGMAPLAPCPEAPELTLARPFLDVEKARLVAHARAAGLAPVDDPSNRDPRFARARLRPLLAQLAREGADAARFARLAARMRRAEAALEESVDAAFVKLAFDQVMTPRGVAAAAWAAQAQEIRLRLLARALTIIGAQEIRLERLEALETRLCAAVRAGADAAATLAGVAIRVEEGALRAAAAPPRRPSR